MPRSMTITARQMECHDAAVAQGKAGYLDPDTGLFVMTSAWLTRRGYCCGNGCRHCPYPPDVQALAGRPGSVR